LLSNFYIPVTNFPLTPANTAPALRVGGEVGHRALPADAAVLDSKATRSAIAPAKLRLCSAERMIRLSAFSAATVAAISWRA